MTERERRFLGALVPSVAGRYGLDVVECDGEVLERDVAATSFYFMVRDPVVDEYCRVVLPYRDVVRGRQDPTAFARRVDALVREAVDVIRAKVSGE